MNWKVLVNAAIVDEGQLLLAKRSDIDVWELPGGKIEKSEQPTEALERELKEELSLIVDIERLLESYSVSLESEQPILHITYLVSPNSEYELDESIHTEIRWISASEARKILDMDSTSFEEEYALGMEYVLEQLLSKGILYENKY